MRLNKYVHNYKIHILAYIQKKYKDKWRFN